jgi:hypothetical protein
MNTKQECIAAINLKFKAGLSSNNTSYSNINKSKNVWWLNIATSKFKEPVNLLLKTEDGVFWINLPIGFVTSEDKDVVDLEINAGSNNFLFDLKSGGTGFDFNTFVKEEIFLF